MYATKQNSNGTLNQNFASLKVHLILPICKMITDNVLFINSSSSQMVAHCSSLQCRLIFWKVIILTIFFQLGLYSEGSLFWKLVSQRGVFVKKKTVPERVFSHIWPSARKKTLENLTNKKAVRILTLWNINLSPPRGRWFAGGGAQVAPLFLQR